MRQRTAIRTGLSPIPLPHRYGVQRARVYFRSVAGCTPIHHTVRGFLKIHPSNPCKLLNEGHLRQQGAKYLLLVRPRCGHPEGWFLPLRLWAMAVLPAVLRAFHLTLSLRGGPRVHICGPGSVSSSQPWRTTGKTGARPETPRLLRCNAVLRHQSTLWEECQASRPGATRPEAAPDQRTAINSSC